MWENAAYVRFCVILLLCDQQTCSLAQSWTVAFTWPSQPLLSLQLLLIFLSSLSPSHKHKRLTCGMILVREMVSRKSKAYSKEPLRCHCTHVIFLTLKLSYTNLLWARSWSMQLSNPARLSSLVYRCTEIWGKWHAEVRKRKGMGKRE